jgi:hypothetical protein
MIVPSIWSALTMSKKQESYRVEIINVQTIGARCGVGCGKTLAEAQRDAMEQANARYSGCNPRLSESGWEVYVDGGVNC